MKITSLYRPIIAAKIIEVIGDGELNYEQVCKALEDKFPQIASNSISHLLNGMTRKGEIFQIGFSFSSYGRRVPTYSTTLPEKEKPVFAKQAWYSPLLAA